MNLHLVKLLNEIVMKKQKTKQILKSVILATYILISLSVGAQNQSHEGHKRQGPPPLPTQEQINERIARLSNELALTEAQEKQVTEIFNAHFAQMKEIRDAHEAEQKKDRQEMEKHRKNFEEEIKGVLNTEQQEKFEQIRQNHKPPKGDKNR